MFRNEIAHGTAIDEDSDGCMIEGAFEGHELLGEQAADFECVCSMCLYLDFRLGFWKEVG